MVESTHFLEFGDQDAIQYDLISEVRTMDTDNLFYFIEFVSLDDQVDVWIFSDREEYLLAYEYALLSIELYKVISKIHAKFN